MSDRQYVCEEGELAEGESVVVEINNISVGVFRVDDEYHALLNNCLHQNGPLCEGNLIRDVEEETAPPGERGTHRLSERKVVVCPWHGWAYDVETGDHAGSSDLSVPTYDVVLDDGKVFIDP